VTLRRHCEERSDEAIQLFRLEEGSLDCFASLAMTAAPRNDGEASAVGLATSTRNFE
jgi:hypothetical protein